MQTAESERQSLSAPTAEAPPTAWAQSRIPRDLNSGLPERLQRDRVAWQATVYRVAELAMSEAT